MFSVCTIQYFLSVSMIYHFKQVAVKPNGVLCYKVNKIIHTLVQRK